VDFRRLMLFIACSMAVVMLYSHFIIKPRQPEAGPGEKDGQQEVQENPQEQPEDPVDEAPKDPLPVVEQPEGNQPPRRIALGSQDPDQGYQLVVYFTSEGAAIERAEMVTRNGNSWKFAALEMKYGYLGYLGLSPQKPGGCRVGVVAAGSPAALAQLLPGDLLTRIDDRAIKKPADLDDYLAEESEPGQSVTLTVTRGEGEQAQQHELTATLTDRPLEIIDPDPDDLPARPSDNSCLLSLYQLGNRTANLGQSEIDSLPSLRNRNWQLTQKAGSIDEVEFRFDLNDQTGLPGGLSIIKRYRLRKPTAEAPLVGYQLDLEIEIINRADEPQDVAYRLDGPNNLPLEGWWYAHKVQPGWGSAGMRDVIWKVDNDYSLRTCNTIYKYASKNPQLPQESFVPSTQDKVLEYAAVDTQFFLAGLMPGSLGKPAPFIPQHGYTMLAEPIEQIEKKRTRTANVSFFIVSPTYPLEAGASHTDKFVLFMAPKDTATLQAYKLNDALYYGWFGFVARPLSAILHFFFSITGNYALAIILLTVLVRGCMFPVSRKAARSAQIMQLMGPEMKKLQEKHKEDPKKKMQAQQDLFRKYNHNPFGGCLPMFMQLPIFLGLYRCIMVDISLRQAPLIPGLQWCSNLAGPDMMFHWEGFVNFVTARGQLFGPYLNVLPLAAIGMIMLQQKVMMPAAQDDQQKMQQKMMKFMMIFMGVMFFKIASGLCLYFIVSGIWGMTERLMLPKLTSLDELRSAAASTKRSSAGRGKPVSKKNRSKRRRLR